MSVYTAQIEWSLGQGENFAGNRYSRAHQWSFDGGAIVPASSSPSVVPLPWSDAGGVDPEEALVASASSCHMLWFLSLAAAKGHTVTRYVDKASGIMAKDDRGRIAMTKITLAPDITFADGQGPDAAGLADLHHQAHEKCFIANSLRSEIVIAAPAPAM
ncbi:MAG: OsmC family protein [Parvibaculum sp.]|nr:OsmC family protein [Parvibaculum sp.]|tara:strand:+ start:10848 stop:11324 length:477 start_codon:yes stop_codon:yes gene_type:complete